MKRHDKRRHPPVPALVVIAVAARADRRAEGHRQREKLRALVGLDELRAFGILMQTVVIEFVAMQHADVTRIECAFHGLQPIRLLLALGPEDVLAGTRNQSKFGGGGCSSAAPCTPDQTAASMHGYAVSLTFALKLDSSGSEGMSTHWPERSNFQPW